MVNVLTSLIAVGECGVVWNGGVGVVKCYVRCGAVLSEMVVCVR